MLLNERVNGATGGSMRRKFLIVFNPTAGRLRPLFLRDVIAHLERHGAAVTVCTDTAADAVGDIGRVADGVDAVVAAGGDGTVRRLARRLPAAVPVGIIPLGTGNVLAREIGQELTPAAVAATLLDGAVADVAGGRANGDPFYLMAGVGFDARCVAAVRHGLKRVIGRAAYGPALAAALATPPDELNVRVDGATYAAHWVIVANARRYGGNFDLAGDWSIFAAGLHAILMQAPTRRALVGQLLRLAQGGLAGDNRNVMIRPVNELEVKAARAVPAQLDGDAFGSTPLTIDAGGPQLRLIVPRNCKMPDEKRAESLKAS